MNVESIVTAIQVHYQAQPLLVVVVVVCLLVLAWIRPKLMFKTLVGAGCIVVCSLMFTSLTGTLDAGVKGRDTMIETAGK